MTSVLHFITGYTVMLLGIILGIIGLSQAFRYILHWLIYSVCPFMNVWCNIWDRGFTRLKVLGFPPYHYCLWWYRTSAWSAAECTQCLTLDTWWYIKSAIKVSGKHIHGWKVNELVLCVCCCAYKSYLAAMCAQETLFLRVCWKALSPQVRHTLDTFHKAPEEINIGSSRL